MIGSVTEVGGRTEADQRDTQMVVEIVSVVTRGSVVPGVRLAIGRTRKPSGDVTGGPVVVVSGRRRGWP
jgi:hypothetical protein